MGGETIVQLEIMDTEITDQGSYQLVAKSETGETQSQTVTLQEEQVKMEAAEASPESVSAATEETSVKKKKKKVVKKKKKKEAEKEIPKPELSSYLKNFIKKEGESIEMKCRLEEEYEEGDVKMTWFFNDEQIESNDKYMITFDGTYATLFIAACTMEDMGNFKVLFENKSGSDESTGKVTVKPKAESAVSHVFKNTAYTPLLLLCPLINMQFCPFLTFSRIPQINKMHFIEFVTNVWKQGESKIYFL